MHFCRQGGFVGRACTATHWPLWPGTAMLAQHCNVGGARGTPLPKLQSSFAPDSVVILCGVQNLIQQGPRRSATCPLTSYAGRVCFVCSQLRLLIHLRCLHCVTNCFKCFQFGFTVVNSACPLFLHYNACGMCMDNVSNC